MRLLRVALPTVSIALLATLGSLASAGNDQVVGSGKRASSVRSVAAFRAISLDGAVDLEFRAGATQHVELVGDDNLLPLITTSVRDGALHIDSQRSYTTRTPLRAI